MVVWEALSEYSRLCKDQICDVKGSVLRSLVRAQPVLSSVFYSWTSYSTEKLLFGKSDRIPGLLASQHGGLGIPCSYSGYTKEQTGVKQAYGSFMPQIPGFHTSYLCSVWVAYGRFRISPSVYAKISKARRVWGVFTSLSHTGQVRNLLSLRHWTQSRHINWKILPASFPRRTWYWLLIFCNAVF